MPGLTRVGDLESGHDGYEPVRLATGSPNVFINGRRAGRVGDVYEAHGGHRDVIVSGSPTIFINGRPAARIGDSVAPGGSVPAGTTRGTRAAGDAGNEGGTGCTVAQCSLDVSIQPMSREDAEIITGFWTNWIKVWTNRPNYLHKLILALPDIAERQAGKATNERDKIGWLLFAGFIRKWLSGKAGKDIYAVSAAWVDLDWVRSYTRGQEAWEDIMERLWNDRAKIELAKMAIDVLGDKDEADFDFVTEHPGKRYFQYANVSSYEENDGLAAALGNFSFRAIAKGKIKRNSDGTFKIHVSEAYVVLWDSFDFEGGQFLGWWDLDTLSAFPSTIPFTYLSNNRFERFRIVFGIGHDFRVRSKLVPVSVPKDYDYPLVKPS